MPEPEVSGPDPAPASREYANSASQSSQTNRINDDQKKETVKVSEIWMGPIQLNLLQFHIFTMLIS
jgi:hypothetical protein